MSEPAPRPKAEKKKKKGLFGLEGGIQRRWFLKSISVILLVLLLLVLMAVAGVAYYFYSSMESALVTRADTQARYLNRYFSSSFSEFYE